MKHTAIRLASLAIAAALTACQAAAPTTTPPRERAITVRLAPAKQLLALVSRQPAVEVDHYVATLLTWDGDSFEPTNDATSHVKAAPEFHFEHLAAARYQIAVVGYDAGDAPLTKEARSEAIDFVGNDVVEKPTVTLTMAMRDTVFSGTLTLPSNAASPGAVPGWVTGLRAVVKQGDALVAEVSYTPGERASVKRLAPGVAYTVELTATDGADRTETKSYTYHADASAEALEEVHAHDFFDRTFTTGSQVWDMTLDSRGNVWAASLSEKALRCFSPTGETTLLTLPITPSKVRVGRDGAAWITDAVTNQVMRISPADERFTRATGTIPNGLAIDDSGVAWIANSASNTVTRVTPSGDVTTHAVGTEPVGVAIDHAGNVWVTNRSSDTVSRLSADGLANTTIAVGDAPEALAVDAQNRVWVANGAGNSVTRLSPTGESRTFSTGARPKGLAIDRAGNVWVANSNADTLTHILPDETTETVTVGINPSDVSVDGAGNVWSVDNGSSSATRISTTGQKTTYTVNQFPRVITVDEEGNGWVAGGTTSNIWKFVP